MILVHLVSMSGAGCRVYIEGEVNVNVNATNFLYLITSILMETKKNTYFHSFPQ